jgi:hypothetical protein
MQNNNKETKERSFIREFRELTGKFLTADGTDGHGFLTAKQKYAKEDF